MRKMTYRSFLVPFVVVFSADSNDSDDELDVTFPVFKMSDSGIA